MGFAMECTRLMGSAVGGTMSGAMSCVPLYG